MPVVKICTNRQITIPKSVFDELGLKEGDFMEVTRSKEGVVVKPKILVSPDDILTPEEEKLVRRGEAQLKKGKYVRWENVKKKLKL
jgi:AbrB family looped-hinge helix DNA binding protein